MDVLVVEDSPDSQDLVNLLLGDVAQLTIVPSVKKVLKLVKEKKFDLILMDVMLEDGNGFELTQKLRNLPGYKDIPVIFMTSKSDIQDKTQGFELGAEDYIVKPFDKQEFKLRVMARLKKIQSQMSSRDLVSGNLRLEPALQKASLIQEAQSLDLTPIQFKILFALARSEPEVLSRDQITELIWGAEAPQGRSLDTHVTSLRKRLGSYASCIESIYGRGYRFKSEA